MPFKYALVMDTVIKWFVSGDIDIWDWVTRDNLFYLTHL